MLNQLCVGGLSAIGFQGPISNNHTLDAGTYNSEDHSTVNQPSKSVNKPMLTLRTQATTYSAFSFILVKAST